VTSQGQGDADDRDIRRVADLMIRAYGANAPLYALQSVDLLLERGDFKTAAHWQRVCRATAELLAAYGWPDATSGASNPDAARTFWPACDRM
jgi:hypothetical protein